MGDKEPWGYDDWAEMAIVKYPLDPGGNSYTTYADALQGAVLTDVTASGTAPTKVVKGQMVEYREIVSMETESVNNFPSPDVIKEQLAVKLAMKMLKDGLIAFTRQENFLENNVYYRAYAYVLPDDNTHELRNIK